MTSQWTIAGGWTVAIAACAETSTCCPRPVRSRADRARSAPIAAYMPVQKGDCGSVVRTGVRPGSPASQSEPLAAVTSRSDPLTHPSGPVVPYAVMVTRIARRFTPATSP